MFTFSVVVVDLPTDSILSFLFPAETDVLVPVFSQSTDVVVVSFVVILKFPNTSLTTAHFPTEWKQAIVNPLLKKGAKVVTHNNLRPISNLQFVSKITESAVFDQVYSHMTDNELFPVVQSAYRKGHSMETALLRVLNDILSNMNKQHVSILVLLDFSAAFDTVDHAILLHRLETSFGIMDAALAWSHRIYLNVANACR